MAKPDDATALAATHGGTARRYNPSAETPDAKAAKPGGKPTPPDDAGDDLLSRGERE